MNPKRQAIFDKYNGHCAYCGCKLKSWQADHLIPRSDFIWHLKNKRVPAFLSHLSEGDCDHIDNMMPACGSCNNYKSVHSLEDFRNQLGLLVTRLNSTFNQYKIAKRFGLVVESGIKVTFYFETQEKI